jgi:predicted nucleic acid-binding protein
MDVKKCLDTYALVEISLGNPKFSSYLKSDFVITDITLAEFYAVILREQGEEKADYWYLKLEGYSEPVGKKMLVEAVRFRHKNKGISFFDAAGYVFSLAKGYKFVTGDKEFEAFKGVEFRKK